MQWRAWHDHSWADPPLVRELTSDDYKAKVMHDYPKLFTGLGVMKEEYVIKLKDDAKPFALTVPRKVRMPLYDVTKSKIERMLESGVISPLDNPTEWCVPMVVTPKPNGRVRVCVDLTKLNEYVQRENHPLPSVDITLSKFAGARYFTKLDGAGARYFTKLDAYSGFFFVVFHKARCELWLLADQVIRKFETLHDFYYTLGSILLQCYPIA